MEILLIEETLRDGVNKLTFYLSKTDELLPNTYFEAVSSALC